MKKHFLTLAFMQAAACLWAQTAIEHKHSCGTPVPSQQWDAWFNSNVEDYKTSLATGKTQAVNYTIPVIVHIIHGGQPVGTFPNISQTQVNSQFTVLNQDFSASNVNVANLASTGFSLVGAANCSITFCPATRDTNGNLLPEPGIDRVNYVTKGWSDPAAQNNPFYFKSYVDSLIKPATIWNTTRYLNIWVSDCTCGLVSNATFPGGSGLSGLLSNDIGNSTNDGIYCTVRAFGNTGNLLVGFDQGHLMTHEAGHWLGLRHIWGDTPCGNDYCNDTPTQAAPPNPICPSYPNITCSNGPYGDMIMNFMNNVEANCMYMFTPDQRTRMQTALQNGTYRSLLNASSASLCSMSAPVAAFSIPATGCKDSLIIAQNQTGGNPLPSYAWSALPSAGVVFSPNNTSANPTIKFNAPGTYSVTLVATNAAGTSSLSGTISISNCALALGLTGPQDLKVHIRFSPNPSRGIVNISTSFARAQNLSISLHNCLGQLVAESKHQQAAQGTFDLDLNDYPNGVYLLTFSNGQTRLVERLILNR